MNQEPTKQDMEEMEAQAEKISEETGKDFYLALQEICNQRYVYNQKEQQ